jgi:hypothetical protein
MGRDSGATNGHRSASSSNAHVAERSGGGARGAVPVDALILATEPGADAPIKTAGYDPVRVSKNAVRGLERVALYLMRLMTGVIIGGGVLLATTRWTHLQANLIANAFLAVFAAVLALVGACAGFYYGAVERIHGSRPPED